MAAHICPAAQALLKCGRRTNGVGREELVDLLQQRGVGALPLLQGAGHAGAGRSAPRGPVHAVQCNNHHADARHGSQTAYRRK